MRNLTLDDFHSMGWARNDVYLAGIVTAQAAIYPKFGIKTAKRLCMMWAQFQHESGAGTELVESLNYSADALLSQWPSHFTTAQAEEFGRTTDHAADQPMIGNLAYGGRMGNGRYPSTDGYDFRGRGLIQTTGRAGYADLGAKTGLDLLHHPDLVNDPSHALLCGVAEFVGYPNMLALCDAGNVEQITREINGGLIGLDERKALTLKWLAHLGVSS